MFLAYEVGRAEAEQHRDAAAKRGILVVRSSVFGKHRHNICAITLLGGLTALEQAATKVVRLIPRTIAIVNTNFFVVLWFYLMITF